MIIFNHHIPTFPNMAGHVITSSIEIVTLRKLFSSSYHNETTESTTDHESSVVNTYLCRPLRHPIHPAAQSSQTLQYFGKKLNTTRTNL
jgi:hypothetical protein